MDGNWLPGGLRRQGWISRQDAARRRDPGFLPAIPALGLVVGKHYKDETGQELASNYYGMFTEYDVLLVRDFVVIHNVPLMTTFQGIENAAEVSLTAAEDLPNLEEPDRVWSQVMESTGDLVAITWIDGDWPVIYGSLNHLRGGEDCAGWSEDSTTGPRAGVKYNDVTARIDKDSNVRVDVPDSKVVEFYVDGDLALKVFNDGGTVRVDMGSGAEKVILGESFRSYFNDADGPANHVHVYTKPDGVGGPGVVDFSSGPKKPTLPSTPLVPVAMDNMDASNLSDVTKTE